MASAIYSTFVRELRTSVARSFRSVGTQPEFEQAFEVFEPVWVLVHGLKDSANVPNPTKAMLLSYLREADRLEDFIAVSRDHHVERKYGNELQAAHGATLFTSYFNELVSDTLMYVNSFHLSNYRSCVIALRCVLEDLYRHLYYRDNREHFLRVHEMLQSEHDLKLAPATFRTYLEKATYLSRLNGLTCGFHIGGKTVVGFQKLNAELYARTSAYVHGSSPSTLNGFSTNMDMVFEANRAADVLALGQAMSALVTGFLSCAHLDQFSRLNEGVKRSVLRAFTPADRPSIRRALRT